MFRLHPLLRLTLEHPHLLAEHASAYAAVLAEEAQAAATQMHSRFLLHALAGACGMLALILAGVALMLLAALPETSLRAGWVLIVVPAFPAALAITAFAMSPRAPVTSRFAALGTQAQADLALLREFDPKATTP